MKTIGKFQLTTARLIILALLLMLILIKASPGYFQGKWSWQDLPHLVNVKKLQKLKETGLNIPEWETIEHKNEVNIGEKKWSFQVLTKKGENPLTLLLQPQIYYKDQPGVEWTDIDGRERWQTDSLTQLKVILEENGQKIPITTRFFRGWNQQETYAVIQWYAMPGKGHFSSATWFWDDLFAQLKGQRIAWVAVCLKIEIEPLGEIKEQQELAESFVKIIQSNLEKTVFNP
jgi:cyanoexosortase B-associated protein